MTRLPSRTASVTTATRLTVILLKVDVGVADVGADRASDLADIDDADGHWLGLGRKAGVSFRLAPALDPKYGDGWVGLGTDRCRSSSAPAAFGSFSMPTREAAGAAARPCRARRHRGKILDRPVVRVAANDGFSAKTLRECWNWSKLIVSASGELGMNSSVSATAVRFDDDSMWVELSDGRTLGVPLAWFPRLLRASPAQRRDCRISKRGLHWEALDEDISVSGLLAGRSDRTRPSVSAAAE